MSHPQEYSIWHPFTQMKTASPALKVKSGSGIYLQLEDGRKIIDCVSSWWVNLHGHSHPVIAEAIYKQALELEHVIFAGFTHAPAENISREITAILPEPLKHVFFSDNGSSSVEIALKMAHQYWYNLSGKSRTKFIGFDGGYHGDTIGAMSIGGSSPFWKPFESLMFSIDVLPYPATWENNCSIEEAESQCLNQLSQLVEKNPLDYTAICLEPLIQGAGGMRICRPEFLQKLAAFAQKHEIILIYDEVMTGFGRTGDYFASVKSNTSPDIICLSKGITGGFMPMAITVCNDKIFEAFLSEDSSKTFFHGHSYTANPLACAAAIASLKLLKENSQAFRGMEAKHRYLYTEHLANHPLLKKERYCGTIFAVDVETPEESGYFNQLGPLLRQRFLDEELLLRPLGNTLYLMPPYCINDDELASIYIKIKKVLDTL